MLLFLRIILRLQDLVGHLYCYMKDIEKHMKHIIITTTIALLASTTSIVKAQDIQSIIDSLRIELGKVEEDSTRSLILAELGYRYYLKPDSALQISKRGLALAESIGYKRGIAANQHSISNNYAIIGDYTRAFEYVLKALEWQRDHGTPDELARSYTTLGMYSCERLGCEGSKKNFKEALRLYEMSGSPDISMALNNLGVIYGMGGIYDSAAYYLIRGLAIAKKNGSREFEGTLLNSTGELYLAKKEYTRAEYYFLRAVAMNESLEPRIQSINYLELSQVYKETSQIEKAIINALTSLQIAKETADQAQIEKASLMLHELYLQSQNYNKAIQYLKDATHAHDSLYSIAKNKEIQRLKIDFEVREKEAQIKILQQQSSLQQVEMQLQNDNIKKQRFLLFGLLVMLVFLAITLTWYRIANRTRRELEIERVRNHIAQDLHDDIGSTLSSIKIISKMGTQNDDKVNLINSLTLIENHSGKMLSTMADIVWSINPNNDTMEKVLLHMKEFAAEILEPMGINYQFIQSGKIEKRKLDVTVRKNLFLIFKEAINNAVKYSGCTAINIHLTFRAGQLKLEITDNGNGFDFHHAKLGNGLNNMKERAALIKGQLEILTNKGKGTVISVHTAIT